MKSAIRNVLLRRKVGEAMEKIRAASKVEILDEDLKKYAEDAAKAAKTFQEKQQKALDQGGSAAAPAARRRRRRAHRPARATCSFPAQ